MQATRETIEIIRTVSRGERLEHAGGPPASQLDSLEILIGLAAAT